MRALLTVALDADSMPDSEKHARDFDAFERAEYVGEGPDWETARDAALAQVPAGAMKLHWARISS